MLHLPRFMLAAPASGSGKTMITCGLLEAFARKGCRPASFKCGPDYIDPMFHTRVIGTPSRNLDTFFTDEKVTRYLFARSAGQAGISVFEGVMGLYDGLGGILPDASSWHLAEVTDTPIVLVVNAKGMSLSVVPFLKGFADFEEKAASMLSDAERETCAEGAARSALWQPDDDAGNQQEERKTEPASRQNSRRKRRIRGVILNRVSAMTYRLLKPVIEEQTGLLVFGYVPALDACRVESRHLGLVTPGEIEDLQQRISTLAKALSRTVDLDALMALAQEAPDYENAEIRLPQSVQQQKRQLELLRANADKDTEPLRIGVARDEAFCFYYQDNLELLELFGAQLVPFSPLHDSVLPPDLAGLLLGGGYPELYAEQLSENESMKEQIRTAVLGGLPCLAECGGFMYLHERMQDMEGKEYRMAGAVEGLSYRTQRLGRFGYITLKSGGGQLLPKGQQIRGHEFHYFDSENPGSDYSAEKPVTGRSWSCIHGNEHGAWGYPHLYYWSNPEFAARFLERAVEYQSERKR